MTRRLATTIAGAALLVAATACATPQSGPDQAPAPAPPAQSAPVGDAPEGQPGVVPPDDAADVPDTQITAELPEGFPADAWTADGGTTVGVVAQEGGCGKASVEVTEQSAQQVVLTLVETTPAAAEMCTMDIRTPTLAVELDAPLAERPLVLKSEQRTS